MFPLGVSEIAKPEVLLVGCEHVRFRELRRDSVRYWRLAAAPPTFIKRVTLSLKGIMEMSPAVLSEQSDPVETVS